MVLLPSLLSGPLDSPDLVRVRARRGSAREPVVLAAWSVPVVSLAPAQALTFLDDPGHEARYGASVRYFDPGVM